MTATVCIATGIAAIAFAGLLAVSSGNRIALAQDTLEDRDTHSGAGILLPNLAKPTNPPPSGAPAPNNTSEGPATKKGSDQNTKDASPKYKWVDEQGRAH